MKLVPQQPGAREIKVKLMLSGGHAAMLVLPPEHPLLAQLAANDSPRRKRPRRDAVGPAVSDSIEGGGRR
jgi:hypothetical protein